MFRCNHLNHPGQTKIRRQRLFCEKAYVLRNVNAMSESVVPISRNAAGAAMTLLIVGALSHGKHPLLQKSNETVANGLPLYDVKRCCQRISKGQSCLILLTSSIVFWVIIKTSYIISFLYFKSWIFIVLQASQIFETDSLLTISPSYLPNSGARKQNIFAALFSIIYFLHFKSRFFTADIHAIVL